jgi:hypothetical protein
MRTKVDLISVWIRIGFNADPDPGSQTNADLCVSGSGSCSDFVTTEKFNFYMKI